MPKGTCVEVGIYDDQGQLLTEYSKDGKTYVQGAIGQHYDIKIQSRGDRLVEVVISVDGLGILTTDPASYQDRGLVLCPGDSPMQLGEYRVGPSWGSPFRFGFLPYSMRSVAALEKEEENLGIIGVAVFGLKMTEPVGLALLDDQERLTVVERVSPEPIEVITIRYEESEGLIALGLLPTGKALAKREKAQAFPLR